MRTTDWEKERIKTIGRISVGVESTLTRLWSNPKEIGPTYPARESEEKRKLSSQQNAPRKRQSKNLIIVENTLDLVRINILQTANDLKLE